MKNGKDIWCGYVFRESVEHSKIALQKVLTAHNFVMSQKEFIASSEDADWGRKRIENLIETAEQELGAASEGFGIGHHTPLTSQICLVRISDGIGGACVGDCSVLRNQAVQNIAAAGKLLLEVKDVIAEVDQRRNIQ